jgi:hypothetical protein
MVRTRLLLRPSPGIWRSGAGRRLPAPIWRGRRSRILGAHAVDSEFSRPRRRHARLRWRVRRCSSGSGWLPRLRRAVCESWRRPATLDLVRAVAAPAAGLSVVVGGGPGTAVGGSRGPGRSVSWAGVLNQSEMGAAYAAADCLALPSQSETWGLVVNEAMATGLPCVVSDRVGCAPELVAPGETGEVFPAGDVGALAAALQRCARARSQDTTGRPHAGHAWVNTRWNGRRPGSWPRAAKSAPLGPDRSGVSWPRSRRAWWPAVAGW